MGGCVVRPALPERRGAVARTAIEGAEGRADPALPLPETRRRRADSRTVCRDRKSTRLNPVTSGYLVCRLLLAKNTSDSLIGMTALVSAVDIGLVRTEQRL